MNTKVAWTKTASSVTICFPGGDTHTILKEAPGYDAIVAELKGEGDPIKLAHSIAFARTTINRYGAGRIMVQDGNLCINVGETLAGATWKALPIDLADRILAHEKEGLPIEPLCRFARKLLRNPSYRAVERLFTFLDQGKHPITEKGNFVAYRKVRQDWHDVHSGTFDNSIGNVVRMSRRDVDDDPNRTCSAGLHVANWDYAVNFYGGGKMLAVIVNPANVVAIPTDYNESKMRVCRFKVLAEVVAPSECLAMKEGDLR